MLLAALFFSLVPSFAGNNSITTPACWTEDASPAGLDAFGQPVQDGVINLFVRVSQISKDDLMKALQLGNRPPLRGDGYPLVYGDILILPLKAIDSRTPPNRARFQRETRTRLQILLSIPGVDGADCNPAWRMRNQR